MIQNDTELQQAQEHSAFFSRLAATMLQVEKPEAA